MLSPASELHSILCRQPLRARARRSAWVPAASRVCRRVQLPVQRFREVLSLRQWSLKPLDCRCGHPCTHTRMDTHRHKEKCNNNKHACAYIRHATLHTFMHAYMHAYMHTYMHTQLHAYICMQAAREREREREKIQIDRQAGRQTDARGLMIPP